MSSSQRVQRSSRLWRAALCLVGLTLVLAVAVTEAAGYFWERHTAGGPLAWTLVASRRIQLEFWGPAGSRYSLLRPNKDYTWQGIPVHVNSHGLRSMEFSLPKPANTVRILNVGDSVVFGWGVRQEESYGERLKSLLAARGGSVRYEVINAGVPGWSPRSARNFFKDRGVAWDPDLVILSLTVVNDIGHDFEEQSAEGRFSGVLDWLRRRSYGWPFLTIQSRFLLSRRIGPEAIPVLNPPVEPGAYFPLDIADPAYARTWEFIADIRAIALQHGVPMMVVVFPTSMQLNSRHHPDVPQRALSAHAASQQVPFVDLLPVYAEGCREAGEGACEGYQNALFADVWMHPNAEGHRLAAGEIFRRLPPAADPERRLARSSGRPQ